MTVRKWVYSFINQFSTNVPLLYSMKTSENLRLFDVFRGHRSGRTLVEKGLKTNAPVVRDHSFSTFSKFSERLTFLTPWYIYVCVRGVRNVSFSENFENVLNEWSLTRTVNHRSILQINWLVHIGMCGTFVVNESIILKGNLKNHITYSWAGTVLKASVGERSTLVS